MLQKKLIRLKKSGLPGCITRLLYIFTALFFYSAGTCYGNTKSMVVAIDIGHGGSDPGAISARGRAEFEFNRELAYALQAALVKLGMDVRLINADGNIGSLRARPAAAAAADFFISLHHDSVGAPLLKPWISQGQELDYSDAYSGYSLFVSRDNPFTAESILCARSISARLQRTGFVPTHKNGVKRGYADYGLVVHYYDTLAVLRHATLPAILFEGGVIKNRDEELRLRNPVYRQRMADAIATGIAACLLNGRPADNEATADGPSHQ